jgi:alginate O-acetyltransferase complex protein AlgI
MVFSSPQFLFVFLPAALLLHTLAGRRLRNLVLLLLSLGFYAWGEGGYVLLMLASIFANHALGRWIQRGGGGAALSVAVVLNLLLLGFYKYAVWAWDNVAAFLGALGAPTAWLGLRPEIHLPLGISFFTFQAISTLVDVKRGATRLGRNPLDFGLYIACFPQLIAGPIVRYSDVAEQMEKRTLDFEGFAEGVRRFVIGLGKKTLLANSTALVVDDVFALPADQLTSGAAWLAVFAWGFQAYFDFSGYSDMAIGLGRMFGFRYRENFDHPLISRSITEFWRRWHISLSTFFRDYVYIPMGGNRRGPLRMYFGLVTVFTLVGLWHGAAWTFVAFGLFHGSVMILERTAALRWTQSAPRIVGHVYFFVALNVSWAIFRADDLGYAARMIETMFTPWADSSRLHPARLFLDGERTWAMALAAVCALPWGPWLTERWASFPVRTRALELASTVGLLVVFVAAVLAASAGAYDPFIYFRF